MANKQTKQDFVNSPIFLKESQKRISSNCQNNLLRNIIAYLAFILDNLSSIFQLVILSHVLVVAILIVFFQAIECR